MAKAPSILLSKETISFVAAFIGLVLTFISGYNWLLSGRAENSPLVHSLVTKDIQQDNRLDRTDQDRERWNANIKELSDKTGELKEAVVKLTTVMETSTTRKAELISPIPLPTMPAGLSI